MKKVDTGRTRKGQSELIRTIRLLINKPVSEYTYEEINSILSNREIFVFDQIGKGETLTTIAKEACLSIKTISTYATRIREKLQLKTIEQLRRVAAIVIYKAQK